MTKRAASKGLGLLVDDHRADAAMWRRHIETPTAASRDALYQRYSDSALKIAGSEWRKIRIAGLERADFEQLAIEALLQTIDRFEPQGETHFDAYLRVRVKGHIRNAMPKASEASAHYTYRRRVERARLNSLHDGEETGLEGINRLADMASKIALGLIMEGRDQWKSSEVEDTEPSAYDSLAWRQLCDELTRRLGQLPTKEAFVLDHHYLQGMQFQQIALLLGLSKGRISQLHAQGLARLRTHMARLR